jgi:hypothetical protein
MNRFLALLKNSIQTLTALVLVTVVIACSPVRAVAAGQGVYLPLGSVFFGAQEVSVLSWSGSYISLTIPPGSPGQQVAVRVVTAEGATTEAFNFTYQ